MVEVWSDAFNHALEEASQWFIESLRESKMEHSIECYLGFSDDETVLLVDAVFSNVYKKGKLVVNVNSEEAKKRFMNIVKAGESHPYERSFSQKPSSFPILTSSDAKKLKTQDQLVFLALMPQNYTLWNARRQADSTNTVEISQSANASHLIKEFLFTSLLLSLHHKIDSIWCYRFYILKRILNCDFLDENGLLIMYINDVNTITLAAHFHPMNYNAWNYRRKLCSLFLKLSSCPENIFSKEIDSVVQHVAHHNGDQAGCSYLLYLLEKVSTHGTKTSASDIWRKLLSYTQLEIRRHYEVGHECMWELRFNLISFAFKAKEKECPFFSSWTVSDEIKFVCAYSDCYGLKPPLLSPNSTERSWYENSGNLSWTSYFACRYGLRLLTLVSLKKN